MPFGVDNYDDAPPHWTDRNEAVFVVAVLGVIDFEVVDTTSKQLPDLVK